MGILFWRKNRIDLDQENVTITITDAVATSNGQDFVNFLRNRDNDSGWSTTDSTDAAGTIIDIDMIDTQDLTDVILVEHNLKSFTIKYHDGVSFVDFSTPINETTNTLTTNRFTFDLVSTSQIQIVINGTFVVDDDKFIKQIILTELLGELTKKPMIKSPRFIKNRKSTSAISGKKKITKSIGGFECNLELNNVVDDPDLTVIEGLFNAQIPFLVALHGFDTSQFRNIREGYRLKDIFLMDLANDYEPEWEDGFFQHGIPIKMKLQESI